MTDEQPETTPGRFDSELPDYPGYFTLPHPFQDKHMQVWWANAIEPLKKLTGLDYETYDGEWKAVVALVRDYGEWKIDGVPSGILDDGDMPMAVKSWAMGVAALYLFDFFPPKAKRISLATM